MAFRIKISSRAKADLDAIYRWIRAERSELAFKWYQALKQATRDLAVNPERCPATTEDRLLRHLLYGEPRTSTA